MGWLKILDSSKIYADYHEVLKAIDSLLKDRGKSKELEDANKRAEYALKEVERLKKELESSKNDKTKITRYDQAVKELSATDWFRKGSSLVTAGNYDDAIAANTKAIQLDPKFAMAYVNRGLAYGNLGNYQQALADSNKAIELEPNNALAYVNRGTANIRLGYKNRAISDYKTAARLGYKKAQDYLRSKGISW